MFSENTKESVNTMLNQYLFPTYFIHHLSVPLHQIQKVKKTLFLAVDRDGRLNKSI